jgi:hypothetical protein
VQERHEVLSVRLTCTSSVVVRGAQAFVTVEVVNVGKEPLWVVGVVDGSETGARYPRWTPVVEGTAPVIGPEVPDFTSPLTPADFRRLAPGERFDPTVAVEGARFFPIATFDTMAETPGRYAIALELDTNSPSNGEWMGTLPDRRPVAERDAARVRELLLLIPRVRIRSNTVDIVVQ